MSLVVADAIWTWFNDPRVIVHPEDGYVIGFADAGGDPGIARLRTSTGIVQRRQVHEYTAVDDHNNPSLLWLDDAGANGGKLLYGCCDHNGLGFMRVSTNAGGVGALLPMAGTQLDESLRAYTRTMQVQDNTLTIYNFAREDAGTGESIFNTSTDGGVTWSATRTRWLTNGTERPYKQYALSADGLRIDFIATRGQPSEIVNHVYHGYVTINPTTGARTWFKGDTTSIGDDTNLPLDLATDLLLIYDGTATNAWVWDLRWIGGTLYCAITYFENSTISDPGNHFYKLGTYDGDSWSFEDIADGGLTGDDYLYSGEIHYSGGITLTDNPNVVYLSRKYGAGDFRVEEWTKSGTWSKTVDVSGNTGSVNARPYWPVGGSHVFYWRGTYTAYNNYATDIHVYPDITVNSYSPIAKPAIAELQPGEIGTEGCTGYWALCEGTGTAYADSSVENRDGTAVGAPAWQSGSFGPEINGFTTTDYISIDATGDLVAIQTPPYGWFVLFKNASASDGVLFGQGRSSSSVPFAALRINSGVAGTSEANQRGDDNANKIQQLAGTASNDGGYHVIGCLRVSNLQLVLFFDDSQIRDLGQTLPGSGTFDRSSIGALVRNTVTLPFPGTIVAAARYVGSYPDPWDLIHDWRTGQFSAIRAQFSGGAQRIHIRIGQPVLTRGF